jgi:hypothetical protein
VPVFGKEPFSSSNNNNNSCDTNNSAFGGNANNTNSSNNETGLIVIEKRNERNEVVDVSPMKSVVYTKQTSVTVAVGENGAAVHQKNNTTTTTTTTLASSQSTSVLQNKQSLKATGPSTSGLPVKTTEITRTTSVSNAPFTKPKIAAVGAAPASVNSVTRQNSSANLSQQQQPAASQTVAKEQVAVTALTVSNTPKKHAHSTGHAVVPAQLLPPLTASKNTFNKIVNYQLQIKLPYKQKVLP